MPRVRRDGVSLFYEYYSNGEDDIVFVEGLGVGRWLWHWQREGLGDEFGLILPDNRGTGNSEAGLPPLVPRLPRILRVLIFNKLVSYSIEQFAADLDAVLADAGVDDVHVVGASMGGMIAQQYVLDYDRARTVTLLCTTPGGPDAVPIPDETLETMYDVPEGASPRETIRHRMGPALNDEFFEANPETIDRILDWRLEEDATEAARESQGAAAANFDVSDRVHEISIPTQIIHGTSDRVVPVENAHLLAEQLPDARLELIDGAPHMLMIEESDRINELVREFVSDH